MGTMLKIGGIMTYGTRYNLYALLAVCPEDDDDGVAAVYGSQSAAPAALPGLPGGVAYQQPPAAVPQMVPAPAVAYPVQPLPVLQQ